MVTADHGRPLLVSLLGPVRAWRGDRELDLGGPQRQAVLGLLALPTNQAVARSELIDGIWGEDPPPSAVNALHVHVAGLLLRWNGSTWSQDTDPTDGGYSPLFAAAAAPGAANEWAAGTLSNAALILSHG